MTNLKQRLESQGKKVKEFYIDNCCSWRNKLKSVFGDDLKVYLDIFHAVQRIGQKIPKRHPLRNECINDLRLVFRQPSDLGKVRTKETPNPQVILHNMEQFVASWRDAGFKGNPVLSSAAMQEISNLKKHIEKGCLSGIRPGRGTNRNENLHKNINSIMTSSRYGIELAYALLATCFYQHNIKRGSQFQNEVLEVALQPEDQSVEKFGLITVNSRQSQSSPVKHNRETLSIDKSDYNLVMERLTGESESYVLHRELDESKKLLLPVDQSFEDHDISIRMLKCILLRAVLWYYSHAYIKKCTNTATLRIRCTPFMNSNIDKLHTLPQTANVDEQQHESALTNVLSAWNFHRIEVPGDGDCLFTSVITYLLLYQEHPGYNELSLLLGYSPNSGRTQDMIKALWELVVQEWLGEKSDSYQSFLTGQQLQREANHFLEMGEYPGDVGDLVLMAVSNILKIPIVIFTSIQNLPIIIQHPTTHGAIHAQPIFLTYQQHGPGHYDVASYSGDSKSDDDEDAEIKVDIDVKCSCGKKGGKGTPCALQLNHYTTRCKCYHKQKGCSTSCKCNNCHNPFGRRSKHSPKTNFKRNRPSHTNQKFPLRGRKTSLYMKNIGGDTDSLSVGKTTDMEYLLISSILEEIGANQAEDIYIYLEVAHMMYSLILSIIETMAITGPLFPRSKDEIAKILKQYLYHRESFAKTKVPPHN